MKKPAPIALATFALAIALTLTGCNNLFFPSTYEIKGKTLTYLGSDGKDSYSYTFDKTGKAGTFEYLYYTFGDQPGTVSTVYNTKVWYQSGGHRGTFTYDEKTNKMKRTFTEYYDRQNSTTAYTWVPLATYAGWNGWTDLIHTYEETFIPSEDREDIGVFLGDDGTYVNSAQYVRSYKISGVTYTTTIDYTYTWAVAAAAATFTSEVKTTTSGTATIVKTETDISTYTVTNIFPSGKYIGTPEFAKVWKKDNIATLFLTRTRHDEKMSIGSATPTEPSINTLTGTGSNYDALINPTWSWDVNMNPSTTTVTFAIFDGFIVPNFSLYASRGL